MPRCAYTTAGMRCPHTATHVVLCQGPKRLWAPVPAPAPILGLNGEPWRFAIPEALPHRRKRQALELPPLRFHQPEFCAACAALVAEQRNTDALRFAPEQHRLLRAAQRTVLTPDEEAQIAEILKM